MNALDKFHLTFLVLQLPALLCKSGFFLILILLIHFSSLVLSFSVVIIAAGWQLILTYVSLFSYFSTSIFRSLGGSGRCLCVGLFVLLLVLSQVLMNGTI